MTLNFYQENVDVTSEKPSGIYFNKMVETKLSLGLIYHCVLKTHGEVEV